jgi:hypothetical protein
VTDLSELDFLLGHWQAASKPGEPTGGFDFSYQLGSQVIIRKNYADYAATSERPGFRHEDLMVIYCDGDQVLRADYYDSEGHVIRYTGETPGIQQAVFTSEPATPDPGFRLNYHLEDTGVLYGYFEVSPPDQPDTFRPYLTWAATRG